MIREKKIYEYLKFTLEANFEVNNQRNRSFATLINDESFCNSISITLKKYPPSVQSELHWMVYFEKNKQDLYDAKTRYCLYGKQAYRSGLLGDRLW
ncbi:hypothetical protein BpHYR1_044259 [Brachionus plicatilis]|uniref:Uncharacterized protein n=1 Tax=Brachionus plicatilis TaxID=10195 RepID=A0A3M7SUV8_BRAPC|nr:hypothetical protein BpHYR1_044259 [Brachionus plicatilis]